MANLTPQINRQALIILDAAIFDLAIDFAESLGFASTVETREVAFSDERVTVTHATADDITRACRQPVSMASVLADLAARLGIELPEPIAAALDEPVSMTTGDASASSSTSTFQA